MEQLPFDLVGHVKPGKQLGSQLGFPTANIAYDPDGRTWPKEGVYVGLARIEGEEGCHVTILNQGRHPTAPGGAPTVEAHLIGYPAKPLYGCRMHLRYLAYLRPETMFPSLDALRSQLEEDKARALAWAAKHLPSDI